jgi:hypothetical protein
MPFISSKAFKAGAGVGFQSLSGAQIEHARQARSRSLGKKGCFEKGNFLIIHQPRAQRGQGDRHGSACRSDFAWRPQVEHAGKLI